MRRGTFERAAHRDECKPPQHTFDGQPSTARLLAFGFFASEHAAPHSTIFVGSAP